MTGDEVPKVTAAHNQFKSRCDNTPPYDKVVTNRDS